VAISFDGPNKIATLSAGTTTLSIPDFWGRWVDWLLIDDNSKYAPTFDYVGGNETSPGQFIPVYLFLLNGWRVRPQEANHTLNVTGGILLVDGGGDPFINPLGDWVVRINYSQPLQAITVATGGGGGTTLTKDDIAEAVWLYMSRTLTSATGAFAVPLDYDFNGSTTASDPGKGKLRWNHATQSLATHLYLDDITKGGMDLTNYFDLVPVGSTLFIQDKWDAGKFQKWQINGITNNLGWFTLDVALMSANGGNLSSALVLVVNSILNSTSPSSMENATAVWNHNLANATTPNTFGTLVKKLLTVVKFLGLK